MKLISKILSDGHYVFHHDDVYIYLTKEDIENMLLLVEHEERQKEANERQNVSV